MAKETFQLKVLRHRDQILAADPFFISLVTTLAIGSERDSVNFFINDQIGLPNFNYFYKNSTMPYPASQNQLV